MSRATLTRQDAINGLARFGIAGPDVYMVDAIPLIEMMWADGKVQTAEQRLLDEFVRDQVANVNRLAQLEVLTLERAKKFVDRFLQSRPDSDMMAFLTAMIPAVRWSSSDGDLNAAQKKRVLRWCLDIAASCVTDYPYGDHDRFSAEEKACYERIIHAFW